MPIDQMIAIVATAVAALAASLYITPRVRDFARDIGFVDRPDGRRKIQKNSVSLGGGLALYLSFFIPLGILAIVHIYHPVVGKANPTSLFGLLIGATILCAVGLTDDRLGMRGRHKLLGQIVACSIILGTGLLVKRLSGFSGVYEVGVLAVPITLFWLLGAINSLNLLDGVDGLTTSVAIVFSAAVGVMAILLNHIVDAAIAFALVGALLGFLRYNKSPASIYLGDAGSMLIGIVLGTLTIRCSIKGPATVAFVAPLAVMSIPLFDSLAAIIRRKLTGRSIYATDRGHIHHRLMNRGFSSNKTVFWIVGMCIITATAAVISVRSGYDWVAIVIVAVVLATLVGTRVFGHVELTLLSKHILGVSKSFIGRSNEGDEAIQASIQLQGSLEWKKMWAALVESAEKYHLTKIRLNLQLPHIHEGFYATWSRSSGHPEEREWRADFPLSLDHNIIGRLEVDGVLGSEAASTEIAHFLDFVEPLEQQLRELLNLESSKEDQPDDSAAQPQPVQSR